MENDKHCNCPYCGQFHYWFYRDFTGQKIKCVRCSKVFALGDVVNIPFELSSLEETSDNTSSHFEIEFEEPVNATALMTAIRRGMSLERITVKTED
jgi:DNA-directed RNA polymerase subunit RPC12/RpoP